jgi:hypothetical protein
MLYPCQTKCNYLTVRLALRGIFSAEPVPLQTGRFSIAEKQTYKKEYLVEVIQIKFSGG